MGLQPRRWRRTFAACAGLGLVAALSCAAAAGAAVGETMPDDDQSLTLEEQRWCSFEGLRLEGQESETDLSQGWEVERHNARVAAHYTLCAGKSYAVADDAIVDQELTPERRDALRRAGAQRVRAARAEREARRAHVRGAPATARAAPDPEATALGAVEQWEDLFPTGRAQGGWTQVEWSVTRPETGPAYAWVHRALLAPGAGAEARFAHCEAKACARPYYHNELMRGASSLDGEASLEFHNGHEDDAYVKLVRQGDGVVFALIVATGAVADVEGIPPGSYELLYGTGSDFSRGCDSFSRRGFAKRFVELLEFSQTTVKWTVSVETVGEGPAVETQDLDYAAFDSR